MKQANATKKRYSLVPHEKAAGATYTPPALARFVARQVVQASPVASSPVVRVLDPAIGDGQLLASLISELLSTGHRRIVATGFDTDADALVDARRNLGSLLPRDDVILRHSDFLDVVGAMISG